MPFYDFCCKKCEILVEDEFFKIADEKIVECTECGEQMQQVILKAPGLSDPGGVGRKWTNDGYQEVEEPHKGNAKRIVTEKWVKGKNVLRSDVHNDDPGPGTAQKRNIKNIAKKLKEHQDAGVVGRMTDHIGQLKKLKIQP